jgi:hypothetical protein
MVNPRLFLPLLLLAVTLLPGCSTSEPESQPTAQPIAEFVFPTPRSIDPPAGEGASAPELGPGASGPLLTWLEKEEDGGHVLRLSTLEGEQWTEARDLAFGDAFFANWADRPAAHAGAGGLVAAHWLEKLGASTYAYGARLVISTDGGEQWVDAGLLHDDESETEHGFVSYLESGEALRAFWLDGRAMANDEPMQLRTTLVTGEGSGASEILDDRVCECCDTSTAMTSRGAVVVYRNRSEEEIRDISIVRQLADGWSEPRLVFADGWVIPGCPVNGPAIAADGEKVAVAWYTGAGESSRVQIAFSSDAGESFEAPILLDGETPVGRIDLELGNQGEAFVTWIGSEGEVARVRLARITPDGEITGPIAIAESSESRSSGVPRLIRDGGRLIVAWVDAEEGRRIRAALLEIE